MPRIDPDEPGVQPAQRAETQCWDIVLIDSSAALQLISREHTSKHVRRFLEESISVFTMTHLSFCVALTLLKTGRHHRLRALATQIYNDKCAALLGCVRHGWIRTVDPGALAPTAAATAESLARAYALDLLDAIELVTIRRATTRRQTSTALLICANTQVVRAARREGLRVWDSTREPPPPRDRSRPK